jgi:hypothetical protein
MDFVELTNLVWRALSGSWHEARIVCLTEMFRTTLSDTSSQSSRRTQIDAYRNRRV